jgi:hypothetical protein
VGVLQERVLARAVFDVPGGLGLAGSADLWRVRLGLPVRTLCLLAGFPFSIFLRGRRRCSPFG